MPWPHAAREAADKPIFGTFESRYYVDYPWNKYVTFFNLRVPRAGMEVKTLHCMKWMYFSCVEHRVYDYTKHAVIKRKAYDVKL